MGIIPGKVSVVIPARNEIFLEKTIQDILLKARGEIEIIVVLDGYWPTEFEVTGGQERRVFHNEIVNDPRVIYIHNGKSMGMRAAINNAVAIATGEFIMKSDAHCMYAEGFDITLKQYHTEDNMITIPRRKRLDADKWEIQHLGKPDIDYEYLSSPEGAGVKGSIWTERILERLGKPEYDIDENMSFQGSCWFMTRQHYTDRLGGMDDVNYGTFVREAQELGLKTWLGGGRVMINKKTWYAHLHKGKTYGRMYYLNQKAMIEGEKFCDDYWFNNRYPAAVRDLAWLIEHFAPVPGWTPELIESVRKK